MSQGASRPESLDHQVLVDRIRHVLGLDPIYERKYAGVGGGCVGTPLNKAVERDEMRRFLPRVTALPARSTPRVGPPDYFT